MIDLQHFFVRLSCLVLALTISSACAACSTAMSYRLVLADVCNERLANHIFFHQTWMKVDNANGKEVMRLLQYLTMVLMSMYVHRDLVRLDSMDVSCCCLTCTASWCPILEASGSSSLMIRP